MTHVTAVNHKKRIALLSDDQVGEITRWFTSDGQAHMDPPPAPVSCVVLRPDGKYEAVDLKLFEKIVRH